MIFAVGAGLAAGLLSWRFLNAGLAALLSWDAFAMYMMISWHLEYRKLSVDQMAARAEAEDKSRTTRFIVILLASFSSIGAVIVFFFPKTKICPLQ